MLGLIPGFDSTQHQLTNFAITINDDTADVVAYMQAEHFVMDEGNQRSQAVGGYYTYKLKKENDSWKIHALKLTVTWTRGNMKAFEIATKRAMNK